MISVSQSLDSELPNMDVTKDEMDIHGSDTEQSLLEVSPKSSWTQHRAVTIGILSLGLLLSLSRYVDPMDACSCQASVAQWGNKQVSDSGHGAKPALAASEAANRTQARVCHAFLRARKKNAKRN